MKLRPCDSVLLEMWMTESSRRKSFTSKLYLEYEGMINYEDRSRNNNKKKPNNLVSWIISCFVRLYVFLFFLVKRMEHMKYVLLAFGTFLHRHLKRIISNNFLTKIKIFLMQACLEKSRLVVWGSKLKRLAPPKRKKHTVCFEIGIIQCIVKSNCYWQRHY